MNRILSLLLVCFSILTLGVEAFAATAQVNNVMSLGDAGGQTPYLTIPEPNTQGYFTIEMSRLPAASDASHLYKNGVAYRVTTGKTFQANRLCYFVTGAADQSFALFSATNNYAEDDAPGTLSGPVYEFGAATAAGWYNLTTGWYCASTTYTFAALTYPGIISRNGVRMGVFIVGKEI